jgi:hypothetical protein
MGVHYCLIGILALVGLIAVGIGVGIGVAVEIGDRKALAVSNQQSGCPPFQKSAKWVSTFPATSVIPPFFAKMDYPILFFGGILFENRWFQSCRLAVVWI